MDRSVREGCGHPRGDDAAGCVVIVGWLVTAGVAKSIILIGQGENAPLDRDLFAGETVGIAAAVVALVVTESNLVRHAHSMVPTDYF